MTRASRLVLASNDCVPQDRYRLGSAFELQEAVGRVEGAEPDFPVGVPFAVRPSPIAYAGDSQRP